MVVMTMPQRTECIIRQFLPPSSSGLQPLAEQIVSMFEASQNEFIVPSSGKVSGNYLFYLCYGILLRFLVACIST